MKLIRYIRLPFLLFLSFIVLGILTETYVLNGGIRQQDIKRFTRTFQRKQDKLDKILSKVESKLAAIESESIGDVFEALKDNNELFEHKELTVLVTKNNELLYWSDHVVGFEKEISQAEPGFVQMPNGWFVLTRIKKDSLIINGLVLIKYNYKIENEYLQNTFARGFHLPDDFQIHFYQSENTYPIYDNENRFLFSIEPSGVLPCVSCD